MPMHNPPHPGDILREMYFEPLKEQSHLTVTEAAQALGVRRQTLSELLNTKTGVSVEMAIRLSIAFDTTPEYWLGLQASYDLWHAKNDKCFDDVDKLVA